MKRNIDINTDVGEGLDNEAELMPYLSSCNIACGGHAGDYRTMKKVVTLADHYNVRIGAHPSFPDKENFGRKPMEMSSADLFSSLRSQVNALLSVLRETRSRLHHIKPHGALYNLAAKDERHAKVVIELVKSISLPTVLFAPYGSVIAKMAKQEGVHIKFESFADRNYNEDLSLVSRTNPNAVLKIEAEILQHIKLMADENMVKTIGGKLVKIKSQTFCIHGDNPNAKNILEYLHKNL